MKKTGEALKKAREGKGLSLHEIGLSLKINSKILKAIEEGDIEHLPAKTFLRGFVQSYAHYLRLDTEEILNLFAEEMGSTRPSPLIKSLDPLGAPGINQNELDHSRSESISENNIEKPKFFSPLEFKLKTFIYGIVILCLVGLIFTVKKVVDRYQREAVVESVTVESPLPDPLPEPAANGDTMGASSSASGQLTSPDEIKGQIEVTTPVPKPATPSEVKLTDSEPEHKSQLKFETKAEEKADPKVEAKNEIKKETKPPPSPEEKPKLEAKTKLPDKPQAEGVPKVEAKPEPQAKARPVELIVEAMDAVEIDYASLSGRSGKIRLAADQVHTFKSSNGLKVSINNGGAVNLILNGKDIGVPGPLGKPISLSY